MSALQLGAVFAADACITGCHADRLQACCGRQRSYKAVWSAAAHSRGEAPMAAQTGLWESLPDNLDIDEGSWTTVKKAAKSH